MQSDAPMYVPAEHSSENGQIYRINIISLEKSRTVKIIRILHFFFLKNFDQNRDLLHCPSTAIKGGVHSTEDSDSHSVDPSKSENANVFNIHLISHFLEGTFC